MGRLVVALLDFVLEGPEFDLERPELFLLSEELLLPVLHLTDSLCVVRRHRRVDLFGTELELALTELNLLLLLQKGLMAGPEKGVVPLQSILHLHGILRSHLEVPLGRRDLDPEALEFLFSVNHRRLARRDFLSAFLDLRLGR